MSNRDVGNLGIWVNLVPGAWPWSDHGSRTARARGGGQRPVRAS